MRASLDEKPSTGSQDPTTGISVVPDEFPDTPWGKGMAMRAQVKATVNRMPGLPHVNDICYYCKSIGHWKLTNGELTCPKWLDEHKPPNAHEYKHLCTTIEEWPAELIQAQIGSSSTQPVRATWDGVHQLVQSCWPPNLGEIMERHLPTLRTAVFEELQAEYGHPFYEVMLEGPESPFYMTAARVLELGDTARACDIRAFLFHVVGLNRLFAGDGFTYREDGNQGVAEFLLMNQRRATMKQTGMRLDHCALGSAPLKECFRYVCDEYVRMREEYSYLLS